MSGTSGQFRLRLRVRWVPSGRVEWIRRGRSGDAIQFPDRAASMKITRGATPRDDCAARSTSLPALSWNVSLDVLVECSLAVPDAAGRASSRRRPDRRGPSRRSKARARRRAESPRC